MKVLIVDNKDSFTYNLKHYINQFTNDVDVVRGSKINLDEVKSYDKIILSPGPGLPEEHPVLQLILERYYNQKPILGICLGQQAIAEFFKAKLENLPIVLWAIKRPTPIEKPATIPPIIPEISFSLSIFLKASLVSSSKEEGILSKS